MKNTKILLFSLLFLSFTSCRARYERFVKVTDVNYTITDTKKIELIYTDQIERKYEPIGFVVVYLNNPLIAKDNFQIQKMKEIAAKNGADAIMKVEIVVTDHRHAIRGLAIKWK